MILYITVTSLDIIKKEIEGAVIFLEPIVDDNGIQGLSMSFERKKNLEHYYLLIDDFESMSEELVGSNEIVCWDARRLRHLFKNTCNLIDMSFFFQQDTLIRAAGSNLTDDEVDALNSARRKIESHVKTCRTSKINLKEYSLQEIIPKKILIQFYKMKNTVLHALWKKLTKEQIESFKNRTFDKIKVFYEIETYGIGIDPHVKYSDSSIGDHRFMKDIERRVSINNDNIVFTGFNLVHTTRTGRIHPIKNTFGCMNIPKTLVRRVIISKFKNGSIASIDMNAADYRCIVSMIDDEFINSIYGDCEDFHDKTVEYIFGIGKSNSLRRKIIKNITYTAIYGGSLEKLSAQTGLSTDKVNDVLKKMKKISDPINRFSNNLYKKSLENGFVNDMLGNKISLKGDEHQGQVLALFAQSCCSKVFLDGVIELHKFLTPYKSHIIFTVHDEVVIDIHEDEVSLINDMKISIENGSSSSLGSKLKAKIKVGQNYWDMK